MKILRIALVLLSIIGLVVIGSFFGVFPIIVGGKMAKDWMGKIMLCSVIGNVFLAYFYSRKTDRQAFTWAVATWFFPVIIPLLLAFIPAVSSNHKEIEREFIDLSQLYTFEEAQKFLSAGKSIDQNEISKIVVNRASDELMRKYSISMPEMVKIVEQAVIRI